MLYSHLRIYQVFGANTNVGKTIFTTALCRATSRMHQRKLPKAISPNTPRVYYLKPVSTGEENEADERHVSRFTKHAESPVQTHCLFKYKDAVSPHLAVKLASYDSVPNDREFVRSIQEYITSCAATSSETAAMYIETAGGVHSPTPSGTTQLAAYRALRIPTILIGDSNLGGISTTISAYESLVVRGYDVDCVLLFNDHRYRNAEYLEKWFLKQGTNSVHGSPIHVGTIPAPPTLDVDPLVDELVMEKYYSSLIGEIGVAAPLEKVIQRLEHNHRTRLQTLDSMVPRALDSIWWPFVQHKTQHKDESKVTVIDSANADFFQVFHPPKPSSIPSEQNSHPSLIQPLYDGSASWWTQALGHSHTSLTFAAAYAAGRYGHVIFPSAIHEPALTLAERLVKEGPGKGWASRAFFSDNGSTGMEAALKMALKATRVRYGESSSKSGLEVLGMKGSYHGDTIGAMDACEEGIFNSTVDWYRPRGHWFEAPKVSIRSGKFVVSGSGDSCELGRVPNKTFTRHSQSGTTWSWCCEFDSLGEIYDVSKRRSTLLAQFYRLYVRQTLERLVGEGRSFGALVIEPLAMGAGGMVFVDPLFHHILIDVVRGSQDILSSNFTSRPVPTRRYTGEWVGIPVIFDEVFTGLYRLGVQTSIPVLHSKPDISVLAKILTGGMVPLSVTLASRGIFEAFLGDEKSDALLHGHSYTAHPIGCAVANETLGILGIMEDSDAWKAARGKWRPSPKLPFTPTTESAHWSFWDPDVVNQLSRLEVVEECMAMGTVLAFKITQGQDNIGYRSGHVEQLLSPIKTPGFATNHTPCDEFGVHYRTLGDVGYLMCSLNTAPRTLRAVEKKLLAALTAS